MRKTFYIKELKLRMACIFNNEDDDELLDCQI